MRVGGVQDNVHIIHDQEKKIILRHLREIFLRNVSSVDDI